MVFLLSNLTIVKTCPDADSAFYHADILKLKDYFVHDVAMSSFDKFTNRELAIILGNHSMNPDVVAKWNREVRLGSIMNLCNNMDMDDTPIQTLYGKLGHVPLAPQIVPLSNAEREKQMGPANTQRIVQRSASASTAPKRPKPGTTTAAVWDKCDELAEQGKSIEANVLRDAVLAWGEEQGINKSTVRTQYGHWKRDKLLAWGIVQNSE